MELKKVFEKPEISVIKFDVRDVITVSPVNGSYSSTHSYDKQTILGVFNKDIF